MRKLVAAGLWVQLSITPFFVHTVLSLASDYESLGHGLNPLAAYFLVNLAMLGAYAAIRLLIGYAVSDAVAMKRGKSKRAAAVEARLASQSAHLVAGR